MSNWTCMCLCLHIRNPQDLLFSLKLLYSMVCIHMYLEKVTFLNVSSGNLPMLCTSRMTCDFRSYVALLSRMTTSRGICLTTVHIVLELSGRKNTRHDEVLAIKFSEISIGIQITSTFYTTQNVFRALNNK